MPDRDYQTEFARAVTFAAVPWDKLAAPAGSPPGDHERDVKVAYMRQMHVVHGPVSQLPVPAGDAERISAAELGGIIVTTLFDAILACIEGPCTKATDATQGIVNNEAWAGLIDQAVKEWADVHAVEASLVAVLIERCLFPLIEVEP